MPKDTLTQKKCELSGTAYVIYDVLLQLVPRNGYCQLTTNQIMAYTGYTDPRTINTALNYLHKYKYIQRWRDAPGIPYTYAFPYPL